MAKQSAGILLYRTKNKEIQFFLVHPGGPFWKNKDDGAWSIPKGEYLDDEDALKAAQREFEEETGQPVTGDFTALKPVRLKSGKIVKAWIVEGDIDVDNIVSNTCPVEWPPRSGKMIEIPEIDKAAWFDAATAKAKINEAQAEFIAEALTIVDQ